MTPVRKPCRTADLIRRILAVLVTVANELGVNTVVALTSELIGQTLAILCAKYKIHSLLLLQLLTPIAVSGVKRSLRLSARVCVRTTEPKQMKLQSTNLPQG